MCEGLHLANTKGYNLLQAGRTIYADFIDMARDVWKVQYGHRRREMNGAAHELPSFCFTPLKNHSFCFTNKNNCSWADETHNAIMALA